MRTKVLLKRRAFLPPGKAFSPSPYTLLMALMALEGTCALAFSLRRPSEAGSALLFGLSPARLVVSGGILALVAGLVGLAAIELVQSSRPGRLGRLWSALRQNPVLSTLFLVGSFTAALVFLALLALVLSPAGVELSLFAALFRRAGVLAGWLALCLVQSAALLVFELRHEGRLRLGPPGAALLLFIATAIYTAALRIFLHVTWDTRFHGLEATIFLPAITLLMWAGARRWLRARVAQERMDRGMLLVFIGVAATTVYWHTAQWVRMENTTDSATWHLLAQAFLDGRLYLANPPTTHDMTFYNGHWYVPSPPLPALLVLPFIAITGIDHFNMARFAVLCGGLNVVLVYAILAKASAQKLIPTSTAGNLFLVVLFALGTTHWWLAVNGVFWYLSQVLTLLFAALAVLLSLHRASPWWIGLSLGVAILARPNVFTLWPLLAGVALQIWPGGNPLHLPGWRRWKAPAGWALATAAPVGLAFAGLLLYNYLRFHDFLDFGYVTVNSADWIMEPVKRYGMFNIHFFPANFQMMFLRLPYLGPDNQGHLYYSPGFEGTSILAMTPALIYLVRRFQSSLWSLGAWASLLLTAGLLLLYSNTGSWQLGYRYLMDFLLPAFLLLAVGVGKKPPLFFILLVGLSVLINAANLAWWFSNM